MARQWFSLGIPVSPTSKTDRNNITEILLKVALTNQTNLICYRKEFSKAMKKNMYDNEITSDDHNNKLQLLKGLKPEYITII